MKFIQKIKAIRFEYQISIIYLILGLLWILFSDRLSESMTNDQELLSHYQTYKGSFYIIITAVLLFLLVKRHLKKIEEQRQIIERAKQKAEESDKLKTAFLQNISHEIRTPMNAIIGFTDLMSGPDLTQEQIEKYKKIIINSSQQLLSVVNDILTVSSLQTQQVQVNLSNVDIHGVLSELWMVFNESAHKKGIELRNLTENKPPVIIESDETKFRQIISNLLSNAIKFTHRGHIEFGYNIKDPWIEFYVQDTGIGINTELFTSIFERFRQGDLTMSKKYGGTGLGLSISKEFVDILGGRIWVESVQGKGSCFYFNLPLKLCTPQPQVVKSLNPEFNSKVILVAEDEEFNFLFIEALLKKLEVKLLHAWNGKEAIDIYTSNPEINLVIMDIRMPVMDGYEATRFLKQINPQLPVIAHTAYALPKDIAESQKYGFDAYVTKPVNSSLLKEIIGKYLPVTKT